MVRHENLILRRVASGSAHIWSGRYGSNVAGATGSEVELRWGVTDEQKAEGAVLPICLAEIDRTRIGDRARDSALVLNNPDAAGHAFFYLRDPAWLDTIPAHERSTFVEESPTGARRLAELRERIEPAFTGLGLRVAGTAR
jgi:hypothetical protein